MTESVTDPAGGPDAAAPNGQVVESAEQLAAIREKRGMGKGEVAQRLKLHPRQLDALERGDWAALPGRAFVRGCVRSYGRLLGVDVEPLLKTIGGFAEAEELKPTSTLHAPLPRGGGGFGFEAEGKGSRLWWAAVGVGAVIAVGLFFGRDGDLGKASSWIGAGPPPTTAPTTTPVPAGGDAGGTSTTVVPGVPLVPPPLVPAPGAPSSPAAGLAAPGASPATPAVPPPLTAAPAAPPAPPAPPPPPPPVRLVVKQDAWVDVRQADGKSIFMGTVKPGTPLELKGTAPYALTIGNASAVTLEYEGKEVDLKGSTSTPNNIAKVKLQ